MPLAEEAFLSRVGHDLRGELATVVAGVHYVMRYEAALSPTAKQMLERVDGAGQRLRKLLDEFDNAVWIGGGDKSQLLRAPINLADVVSGVLERLAPQIAVRNVTVESNVGASLPSFEADGELLGLALEYVIDFAVARSIGGTVRLSSIDVTGAGIRVEDTGGVVEDEALVARLFEPFVEKELVAKHTSGGAKRRERLGLGLAIARGMLGAQGGSVRVERGPEGLVFLCEMPA